MASMKHEALVDLFRNRPTLAAELLSEALGVPLPAFGGARIESVAVHEARPAEYRADLAVTLQADGKAVLSVLVEVQLGRDEDKRYSWPEYLTGARARFRCPASLLIVAPDPAIAAWSAEPIDIGPPGWVLKPPVLGPTAIPVVTDGAEAKRRPELSVLSAMAHGQTEVGAAIALAALPAIGELDEERARFYGDLVYTSLNEAARRALEAAMKGYEYQSDFARKYVAQGRAEGKAEGKAEGEARGRASSLLTVLRARGFEVSEAARERIVGCTDLARLDHWLARAAVASSLGDVLDEPS